MALLLAPIDMVALRGCPTCWIAVLIQTISADRLQRTRNNNRCTLHTHPTSDSHRDTTRESQEEYSLT